MWVSVAAPIAVALLITIANAVILGRVINVKLDLHVQYLQRSIDLLTEQLNQVNERIDSILEGEGNGVVQLPVRGKRDG